MARASQTLLPGLPAPPDEPIVAQALASDPLREAHASLDRLQDIHRRMDALAGGAR